MNRYESGISPGEAGSTGMPTEQSELNPQTDKPQPGETVVRAGERVYQGGTFSKVAQKDLSIPSPLDPGYE